MPLIPAAAVLISAIAWPGPVSLPGDIQMSVPMDIDAHGGVFVNVRVNDSGPYRFIVDTGSSRSIVSDSLGRQVGAPVVARSEVVTSTGSEWRVVLRLDSVSIATARRINVLAATLPDARLSQFGPGVRGLLAQDFLSAFTYTLDYRRARLRWGLAQSCSAPGAVPLIPVEGRFVLPLTDGAGAVLRLVPDSGAEVAVLFNREQGGETVTRIAWMRAGRMTMKNVVAYGVQRDDHFADGLLPLHHFSAVTFVAGGACLFAR